MNETFVPLEVGPSQVLEQTATQTDHAEKSATGMVVFGVCFQVIGQVGNAL
jgi:hypothetical protein